MNFDLLDHDSNPCGSAPLSEILALRADRERLDALGAFDDEPQSGPHYYRVGHLRIEIAAAVPAAVTVAQIANSAKSTYEALASGIEFLPEPVTTGQLWGPVIAEAHGLLLDALGAAKAGYSDIKWRRVYFPDRRSVEEALERLAVEFDEGDPLRDSVARFVAMLRRPVQQWTPESSNFPRLCRVNLN